MLHGSGVCFLHLLRIPFERIDLVQNSEPRPPILCMMAFETNQPKAPSRHEHEPHEPRSGANRNRHEPQTATNQTEPTRPAETQPRCSEPGAGSCLHVFCCMCCCWGYHLSILLETGKANRPSLFQKGCLLGFFRGPEKANSCFPCPNIGSLFLEGGRRNKQTSLGPAAPPAPNVLLL